MTRAVYPNALILAHPNLSHAQAIEVCRREGLRIVQTKAGNFIYQSSTAPATEQPRVTSLAPTGVGVAAGPQETA